MPPLTPHDPLAAVVREAAWRWVDLPVAFAGVAGEPWVLALVALALYAWLEREVRDVLAAFFPLLVAVAASAALALAARQLGGGGPGPSGGVGPAAAPLLWALASGQAAGVSVLAVHSVLAYGRRARIALLFALAFAVARALSGPGWLLELGAGALAGAAVAAAVYGATVKLFPAGRLARERRARRSARSGALADRPSP
jgi:hypothetical protein